MDHESLSMSKSSAAIRETPFHILTDLATPAVWSQNCRQACSQMPALDAVFTMIEKREIPRGELRTPYAVKEESVTTQQAELFLYIMNRLKPNLSLEIGFGDGLLSCVLTAAHMHNGLKGGHVPVEDRARAINGGVGARLMEELNLENYQIMEHPPEIVLPQIYIQNINDGLLFAYMNHATAFDEQMMEYFYVSRLLNEGGVLAINLAHPARRALAEYIRSERHDCAFREMECGVALVQLPVVTVSADQLPSATH